MDKFVSERGGGGFGVDLDGEGDVVVAVQDLGDPVEDVA